MAEVGGRFYGQVVWQQLGKEKMMSGIIALCLVKI
jgi:hypothetical protein